MPTLDVPGLRRTLKSAALAPAYYIHGSEALLKDEATALILDRALDPGTRDFNLDIHSAQQLDPEDLASACATLPMMADRRVVVVRDIEAWKRKSKGKQPAVDYLKRPMPETVLVMVQGGDADADAELAKPCTNVECEAPTGDKLDAWLDDRLAKHGVALQPAGREHLLRATGGDLGLLDAEVQKLSGLDTTGPIDPATVAAMVGIRFGETAEDWRDAVLGDDTARALRLLPRLLETSGNTAVSLVALLGTSLLVLRWARLTARKQNLRGTALAGRIKTGLLFPMRLRVGSYDTFAAMIAGVVEQWPLSRLKPASRAALEADLALKNTTISTPEGIMTDLVLAIAATGSKPAA